MTDLIEAQDRNNRIVLDTTVSADTVTKIPAMNGHQGDNGRVVPFVIVEGPKHQPKNMQGKSIDLVGTDHDGRVKVSGSTYKPINMAVGMLDFTIPGVFYQAVGDYQQAYFRIKDSNNQVISTINVKFSVIEGADYLTLGDSQIYNGYVQQSMAGIEQDVANWVNQVKTMLSGTQGAADIANSAVQVMLAAIQSSQVPTKGGNNVLNGDNTFHGTTVIDNLKSPSLDNLRNQMNQAVNSLTARLSNVLRVDNGWTRDYTLGGCLSRANNGNDFALSKWHIMDTLNIIVGRGDVRVDNDQDYNESQIYLPWTVDNADMAMVQIYHFEGYALPRLDINSKKLNISLKGKRHEIERLSLLIISFDR
ncbi:BppU family phage baseplate upper protein [Limosilactobacillus reuteri]|uniref:BppU family phage baseplate upper protein n=1 Tax=Limosilactobacillus reuteri TaxID=1598 RepID=UPI002B05FB8A|nr:BppU family phage baseplate upper protein [Limosilactobacillus reuteri]